MEEAREFQQAMLPSEMPITDDYEMVGFQKTATEVGGDFFDFVKKMEDGLQYAVMPLGMVSPQVMLCP